MTQRQVRLRQTIWALIALSVLSAMGATVSTFGAPRVQEAVDIQQDATPLGAVAAYGASGQRLVLSVATIALAPGQSTFLMRSTGSALVIIQTGSIRLISDRAPSREFGVEDQGLAGAEVFFPALVAGGGEGVRPAADGLQDPTSASDRAQFKAYSLPQGFAFEIAPGSWVQFQGGTQAQVMFVVLQPAS